MSIIGAILVPHPPVIIPTAGLGQEREVQATIDTYRAAAKQAAAWEPEVLIVTTPHLVMYADYFHISPGKGVSGDMSAFGAAQTRLAAEYDMELRKEIIHQAENAGIRAGTLGQTGPAVAGDLCTHRKTAGYAAGTGQAVSGWALEHFSGGGTVCDPDNCPQ